MSKITRNFLKSFDYQQISKIREENFEYLLKEFVNVNKLKLKLPNGAFAFPLFCENGINVRKRLQKEKIYIPILWPNVLESLKPSDFEYKLAANILPIPCDQRYNIKDMQDIVDIINMYIKKSEFYEY
jgi:dTDP-4-amino-4,6-dideoxygalactose transaminase